MRGLKPQLGESTESEQSKSNIGLGQLEQGVRRHFAVFKNRHTIEYCL